MASPYQEFVRKAKERFAENQKKKLLPRGGMEFTAHARYKMQQYGLSEQKVRGIIRNPKRTETGVAPKTVAMMQPASSKTINGREVWKQEIWVMYVVKSTRKDIYGELRKETEASSPNKLVKLEAKKLRIISAWRYPGVSPKRNPIPGEILLELKRGDILEE